MIAIARDYAAVTPHASNANEFDALYIGNSGNVTVQNADGDNVTFTNVQNGTILPIQTKLVLAVGTTATNITGLLFYT
jgi:hypothetical protein